MTISHNDLNLKAAKYARKTLKGGLVMIEHKCNAQREIVDVAVFRAGIMINIEVKVSRNDFLKDRRKIHRKNPEMGMGDYRFYCAPAGLISPDELPKGWGLLEYHEKSDTIRAKHAPPLLRSLKSKDYYEQRALREFVPLSYEETKTINEFYFEDKNLQGHIDYLYSSFRQLLIAQEEGLEVEISGIFKKPEGLSFTNVMKLV